MSRPHCQHPDACKAKGKGHCRSCHFKALADRNWQDPEFRRRNAEATRNELKQRWQDPGFRARHAEATRKALRERRQDPEFCARQVEAVRKHHGGAPSDLTDYGRAVYDECRADGAPHGAAMKIARRMEAAE